MDSNMWGIRTGLQPNGKYIIGLDFDMWYKSGSNHLMCEKTRDCYSNFKEALNPTLEGVFNSSTKDNKGVFCDISNCKDLINLLGKINLSRFNCPGFHLEIMNGCNWVLPPSKTICKIDNIANITRSFYSNKCILEINKDTNIYSFIYNYIETYFKSIEKSIPQKDLKAKKAKETYLEYYSTNENDKTYFCNHLEYIKPFIDLLSIDRADNYNQWWKIGFSLKQQFEDKGLEMFKYFSMKSINYDENGIIKNWNKFNSEKYNYDNLNKNYIINCAKEDNPDKFIEALLGYKFFLQKFFQEEEKKEYQKKKNEMELSVCKILEPSLWVKKSKGTDEWNYCEVKDIVHRFSSIYGNEFISKYIKDNNIKYLDTITFDPDPNFKGDGEVTKFNLFTPLPISKHKPKDINMKNIGEKLIDTHIKALCKDDKNAVEFLTQWLAWIIHLPHKRTKAVPIIKGVEGGGKTSFFELAKSILTKRYAINTSKANLAVFGAFNDPLEHKLLVSINEANFTTFNTYMDDFKSLITDSTYTQQTKNKPIIPDMPNYLNFMVTTNNEQLFCVSNTDRRFYFIETNDNLDSQYFTNFYKMIGNPDIQYYIYKYLENIINPNFSFESYIKDKSKTTEFQQMIKESSIHPFYLFLNEWVDNDIGNQNYNRKVKVGTLMNKFSNYCCDNNIKNHETGRSIKLKLIKLQPDCYKNIREGSQIYKGYDFDYKVILERMKGLNLLV